jgi:peptide methionine sulfoxide reductase MsrA
MIVHLSSATKDLLDPAAIIGSTVPAGTFYPAEDHQQYLEKRGLARCHIK